MEKKKEIEIVVYLRGLAALMVLLFHLICLSDGYLNNALLNSIFQFGKYGVELFFVISGFVVCYSLLKGGYSIRNFGVFLKKRIIRIEPPFLVILVLTIIYKFARVKFHLGASNLETPTLRQVFSHLGYLVPVMNEKWLSIVFWTLGVEFQFYIIFSLLFGILIGNLFGRISVVLALLGISILTVNEDYFFHWTSIFLSGIYLALFKMRRITRAEFFISVIVFLSFVFWYLGWKVLVFSIIPVLLIYWEPVLRSVILAFLGKISYSIYLSHTLIIFPIISLGIRWIPGIFGKILVGTVAFSATIIFSYYLFKFIEEPSKRIAGRLTYMES